MATSTKKPKTLNQEKVIKQGEQEIIKFSPFDAIILYPSLGCPALVKIEKNDGNADAWLEMIIVTVLDNLNLGQIAYHLKYSEWPLCHGDRDAYKNLDIYNDYLSIHLHEEKIDDMVKMSEPYKNTDDSIHVDQVVDDNFKLQLAHINAFPWVLKGHREKGYEYIYKIGINLKYEEKLASNGTLWNFFWMKTDLYYLSSEKPRMLGVVSDWIKNYFAKKYKTRLSEFDKKSKSDKKIKLADSEEIIATWYNPVYVSNKAQLNIGHVTDIHLDSRMAVFSQSVASVIEVKENCQDGVKIENNERVVNNTDFYIPIKKIAANFNEIFMNISKKLLAKSDVLVITGDLIDYNKGVHIDQTVRPLAKKPSETWDSLRSNWLTFDNKFHIEDRNWFMFYKFLLQLYDDHKKPIFTTLGNHDYVKHATAPWPVKGLAWNGVYDMNLTRYENALIFGEGYGDHKEFVRNMKTSVDCVKWYTNFINPLADYVIDYGGQSMFMVDWAEKGVFPMSGVVNALTKLPINHAGTLHHAANMFLDKDEVEYSVTVTDKDGKDETIVVPINGLPFPIKNYAIYKSWIKKPATVKMMFTHATSICPRDDISVGEINNSFKWSQAPLRYGTFDNKRDEILKDVENGDLHIIVGGHSHRNIAMSVSSKHKDHAHTLAAGETMRIKLRKPAHIALVTSSAGPFPKYIPGGPLVCACKQNYNTGFFYEFDPSLAKMKIHQLYSATDHSKIALDSNSCIHCGMKGEDMVRKPFRRHAPGGNLLLFEDVEKGKVRIESVVVDHNTTDPVNLPTKPRKAVMCEEQEVFTGAMRLDNINSYIQFKKWDSRYLINIISEKPFIYYDYMEFPSRAQYVTFTEGLLPDDSGVDIIKTNIAFERRIRQKISKDSFDALKNAANQDSDFAFIRYSFSASDIWDREMNIGKSSEAEAADAWEKERTDKYNNGQRVKSAFNHVWYGDPYEPKLKKAKYDEFEGMILIFRTIPDFRKRKDTDVCGY